MQNKAANKPRATSTTLAFRYPVARRQILEAIHREKHPRDDADLSVTLREAIDQYIERYLRREGAAA